MHKPLQTAKIISIGIACASFTVGALWLLNGAIMWWQVGVIVVSFSITTILLSYSNKVSSRANSSKSPH